MIWLVIFIVLSSPLMAGSPFDVNGSRSVLDLVEAVNRLAVDVSIWIWRSPDFFGNTIDLEAHDRLHAYRLESELSPAA